MARTVPNPLERITPDWMTTRICGESGAKVTSVRVTDQSSGTTTRGRLHLAYEGGGDTDLPSTVFVKSTPKLTQRMGTLVTGPVEMRFYSRVRPSLEIQAPECHHGAIDPLRGSTILLLEDIARTRGAVFHEAGSPITRATAEEAVRTLAALHGPFLGSPPDFLRSYPAFWRRAIRLIRIDHYYRRCMREATDYLPAEIYSRPAETWAAFMRSVDLHNALPRTVIHNDPHAGNWYSTADGQPGLADWGAVTTGHWSRDLAYALSTMLTIDDRRLWERDLVELYIAELGALSGQTIDPDDAWLRYRQQVWGALAFWAPTFSPPRLVPGDMQPREVAAEMLTRIGAALIDLDSFAAVAREEA